MKNFEITIAGVTRNFEVRQGVGPAATISVGTVTTVSSGDPATVTNAGTSGAAVFDFEIPAGEQGPAGPNSVTSATTSDGTANLSLASVTLSTSATFNNVTWTYGTGAAAAHRTALGLGTAATVDAVDAYNGPSDDGKLVKITNGEFRISNALGTLFASIFNTAISVESPLSITSMSAGGFVTSGTLECGAATCASLTAQTGNIVALANNSIIQTGGTFRRLHSNGNTTTLDFSTASAGRTITFPNATGDVVLDTNTVTLTNKTISGASNTITNVPISTGISGLGTGVAAALASTANATGGVVTVDGTATLTDKTLTTPIINTPTIRQNNASFTPLAIGAGGTSVGIVADNVNAVSGIQMSNINTGNIADFRFLIKDPTDHYFAFAQPGTGNAQTLFGLTRSATDYIFNSGGTARDMAIGTADAKFLILVTNATERVRVTSNGEVGIGTTSPSTRAILDLSSTTRGFLPPRMTTAQRDAISSPPAALMIYNTSTNKLNFYNGSAWEAVTSA